MPSQEGLSALYNKKEGISSDDDDGLMNSCEELRLGNILKAQKEIGVNSSDLASSLQTRLDITRKLMVNAKESFENKKWEDLLTYTKEAIEQGVDLSTELYMNRAEAFLAANLVEEAVSELSSAILSLFKKKHGFKSPGKKEEEAEINEEHFKKATWDISEEKCDLLLEIEEEELQELEDDLLDRVKGLEGAVSLIKKFYQPLINQRADRIQILKGKKERFCTEKLAQSLKKKQEEGSFVDKEASDEEEFPLGE